MIESRRRRFLHLLTVWWLHCLYRSFITIGDRKCVWSEKVARVAPVVPCHRYVCPSYDILHHSSISFRTTCTWYFRSTSSSHDSWRRDDGQTNQIQKKIKNNCQKLLFEQRTTMEPDHDQQGRNQGNSTRITWNELLLGLIHQNSRFAPSSPVVVVLFLSPIVVMHPSHSCNSFHLPILAWPSKILLVFDALAWCTTCCLDQTKRTHSLAGRVDHEGGNEELVPTYLSCTGVLSNLQWVVDRWNKR